MPAIWWMRRDLRLTDNLALHSALEIGSVIPIFILDPAFAKASSRRRNFLYEGLHALDQDLKKRGSYLVVRSGKPGDVLQKLCGETKIGRSTKTAWIGLSSPCRKSFSVAAEVGFSQFPLQFFHRWQ